MQWLEVGQIRELLDHCSARLRPVVEVALLTGMRKGDILALTWDRVDFEQRLIRLIQGKTRSALLLPMSPALATVLQSLPRDLDSPYVLTHRRKGLRRFGWVRTDFARAVRAAGFNGIRFHDLRHTAATQLRRLGRDLQVVQQLLGHKTIRTTLRYSHVHPTELRDAVTRLGEKILPSGPDGFTVTSQSLSEQKSTTSLLPRNDTHWQPEMKSGAERAASMPQTVKREQPSTAAPEEGGSPSSR